MPTRQTRSTKRPPTNGQTSKIQLDLVRGLKRSRRQAQTIRKLTLAVERETAKTDRALLALHSWLTDHLPLIKAPAAPPDRVDG